ncbi:hypothetical protein [Umezawaea beigongshangensis]|uniref:hypothetical protein n=1 Tax=Umezawaea beigongshangensis TaxID=2780383 RepID=UPI0018F1158E|nr:hypothetical protein [Umezawaea beigongshangensis]
MRNAVALVGCLLLGIVTALCVFFGILGFTPMGACEPGATSGACAYGRAGTVVAFVAIPAVALVSVLATWVGARRGPRVAWPYVGLVVTVAMMTGAVLVVGGS